ncbi:MAG: DUF6789 family protein [Terriglobia bacterium]
MKPNVGKAILGGVVGTVLITLIMYYVAPMMTGGPMDIAAMLGSMMGNNWWMGMAAHVINGVVVFPLIYVFVLYSFLPGASWLKGGLWGLALWLLAQVVVMPMMGAGLFSANAGGMPAVMGSLMGHLVYGVALGLVTGGPARER